MTDRIPDEVVEAVERFARDGAGDVAADGGLRVRDSAILRLVAAYRASAPVPTFTEEQAARHAGALRVLQSCRRHRRSQAMSDDLIDRCERRLAGCASPSVSDCRALLARLRDAERETRERDREWYAKLQGADGNWAEAEARAEAAERKLADFHARVRDAARGGIIDIRATWPEAFEPEGGESDGK